MNRNSTNAVIDSLLALLMAGMLLTGLLMAFVLPPGTSHRLTLWGLTRHDFGQIHLWLAYGLTGAIAIHLTLHWTWIVSTARRMLFRHASGAPSVSQRRAAGLAVVLAVILLVGGFWLLASTQVVQTAHAGPRVGQDVGARVSPQADAPGQAQSALQGSMTIARVAEVTGLPGAVVLERLGLPAETGLDERVGRLCRAHGLTMEQARQALRLGDSEEE